MKGRDGKDRGPKSSAGEAGDRTAAREKGGRAGWNPLVSVIVPTFNSARTIDMCLDSVRRQTYPEIELIVIDKMSMDDTVERAKRYEPVLMFTEELRSVARNKAAARAGGEYLIFLDSDITLTEGVVEECVERVREGAEVITFPEEIVGEGFWARCRALEASCYLGDDTIEAPRFMSKRVFTEAGGFDSAYEGQEDWDLRERIFALGYRAERIKAMTMHHEGRVTVTGRLKKKYYYSETLFRYMKRYRKTTVRQVPFLRGAYYRNAGKLLRDPVHGAGFVVLKTLETVVSAAGLVNTRFKKPRNVYEERR